MIWTLLYFCLINHSVSRLRLRTDCLPVAGLNHCNHANSKAEEKAICGPQCGIARVEGIEFSEPASTCGKTSRASIPGESGEERWGTHWTMSAKKKVVLKKDRQGIQCITPAQIRKALREVTPTNKLWEEKTAYINDRAAEFRRWKLEEMERGRDEARKCAVQKVDVPSPHYRPWFVRLWYWLTDWFTLP